MARNNGKGKIIDLEEKDYRIEDIENKKVGKGEKNHKKRDHDKGNSNFEVRKEKLESRLRDKQQMLMKLKSIVRGLEKQKTEMQQYLSSEKDKKMQDEIKNDLEKIDKEISSKSRVLRMQNGQFKKLEQELKDLEKAENDRKNAEKKAENDRKNAVNEAKETSSSIKQLVNRKNDIENLLAVEKDEKIKKEMKDDLVKIKGELQRKSTRMRYLQQRYSVKPEEMREKPKPEPKPLTPEELEQQRIEAIKELLAKVDRIKNIDDMVDLYDNVPEDIKSKFFDNTNELTVEEAAMISSKIDEMQIELWTPEELELEQQRIKKIEELLGHFDRIKINNIDDMANVCANLPEEIVAKIENNIWELTEEDIAEAYAKMDELQIKILTPEELEQQSREELEQQRMEIIEELEGKISRMKEEDFLRLCASLPEEITDKIREEFENLTDIDIAVISLKIEELQIELEPEQKPGVKYPGTEPNQEPSNPLPVPRKEGRLQKIGNWFADKWDKISNLAVFKPVKWVFNGIKALGKKFIELMKLDPEDREEEAWNRKYDEYFTDKQEEELQFNEEDIFAEYEDEPEIIEDTEKTPSLREEEINQSREKSEEDMKRFIAEFMAEFKEEPEIIEDTEETPSLSEEEMTEEDVDKLLAELKNELKEVLKEESAAELSSKEEIKAQKKVAKDIRKILDNKDGQREAFEYQGVKIQNTGSLRIIADFLEGKRKIEGKGRLITPEEGDYKLRLKPDGSLEPDYDHPLDVKKHFNESLRNDEAAAKVEEGRYEDDKKDWDKPQIRVNEDLIK